MAGKNLLVNGKNNITAKRTNALSKIQTDMANRTTATNMNSIETPNLPTPTVNSINLRKAQPVQTPIVQNNAINKLNTNIVQPVQTNTASSGAGTVATIPQQQSMFIGFQRPTGQVMPQAKSIMFVPTTEEKATKSNKEEEQRYKKEENLIKKFHYAVKNHNGQMTANDIIKEFPEWKGLENVALQLQADITPLVQQGQFADMNQISQYYNELLSPKTVQDINQVKQDLEIDNKKFAQAEKFVNKVLETNWTSLSPDGIKYVRDFNILSEAKNEAKKKNHIVGGKSDVEILNYLVEQNPELKKVRDEMNSLQLTETDKGIIGTEGAKISKAILSTISQGLISLSQDEATKPTIEEMESVMKGKEKLQNDLWTQTGKKIATELGVPLDSLEKTLYRAYKDAQSWGANTAANVMNKFIPKSYWEEQLGVKLTDEEYKAIVEKVRSQAVEENQQNVIDYTESVNREYENRKAKNLDTDIENYANRQGMTQALLAGDLGAFTYKGAGSAAQNVDNLAIIAAGIVAPEVVLPAMFADSYARESQESFEELIKAGATYEQAQKSSAIVGLASSAVEVTLEKILGGVETTASKAFHDAFTKEFTKNASKMMAEKGLTDILAQGVTTQFRSSLEEGLEEVLQQTIHNASVMQYDPDQKLSEGLLEAFEGGFYNPMNLLAGGGDITTNIQENSQTIKNNIKQTTDTLKAGAKETAKTVKDTLNRGADNITRNTKKVVESLKSKANNKSNTDNGNGGGANVLQNIKNKVTGIKNKAIEVEDDTTEKQATALKEGSIGGKVMDMLNGLDENTRERIKKNPYSVVESKNLIDEMDENPGIDFGDYQNGRYEDVLNEVLKKIEQKENKRNNDIGKLYDKLEETNAPVDVTTLKNKIAEFQAQAEAIEDMATPAEQAQIKTILENIEKIGDGTMDVWKVRKIADKRSKRSASSTYDGIGLIWDIRDAIDDVIVEQNPEMKEVDKAYRKVLKEISEIKGKLFYQKGGLKSNAVSTIKNMMNAGNRIDLNNLEKYLPGIKQQLEAIRDSKFVYNAYSTGKGSRFISGIARGVFGNIGKALGFIGFGWGGLLAGSVIDAGVDKAMVSLTRKALRETITKETEKSKAELERINKKIAQGKALDKKERAKLKELGDKIEKHAENAKKTKAEQEAWDKYFEDIKNKQALPNGIKLTKVIEINNPKNKVTSEKSAITEKKTETKAENKQEVKPEKKEGVKEQPKKKNAITSKKSDVTDNRYSWKDEKELIEKGYTQEDINELKGEVKEFKESDLSEDEQKTYEIIKDNGFTIEKQINSPDAVSKMGENSYIINSDTTGKTYVIEGGLGYDDYISVSIDPKLGIMTKGKDIGNILKELNKATGIKEQQVTEKKTGTKGKSNVDIIKEYANKYGVERDEGLERNAPTMHGDLISNFLDRTEGPIKFEKHGDGEVAGALDTKLYKQNPQNMSNTFYVGGNKADMDFLRRINRPETENSKAYDKLFEVEGQPKTVVAKKNKVTAPKQENNQTKHFTYDEYGEVSKKIEAKEKEIGEKLDKQYEQERAEKMNRFEELRDKEDKTDAEGKELVKLQGELNNMTNKYDKLKEDELKKQAPELLQQKEELQQAFDRDWKAAMDKKMEEMEKPFNDLRDEFRQKLRDELGIADDVILDEKYYNSLTPKQKETADRINKEFADRYEELRKRAAGEEIIPEIKKAVEKKQEKPKKKQTKKEEKEARARGLAKPDGNLIYSSGERKYVPSLQEGLIRLTKEEGEKKFKEQLGNAFRGGLEVVLWTDTENPYQFDAESTFVYNPNREGIEDWEDRDIEERHINEDSIEDYEFKNGDLRINFEDDYGNSQTAVVDISDFLNYSNMTRYIGKEHPRNLLGGSKNKVTSSAPIDTFEDLDFWTIKELKDRGDQAAIDLYEEMGIEDEALEELYKEMLIEENETPQRPSIFDEELETERQLSENETAQTPTIFEEDLEQMNLRELGDNETSQDIDYQDLADLENETPQMVDIDEGVDATTQLVDEFNNLKPGEFKWIGDNREAGVRKTFLDANIKIPGEGDSVDIYFQPGESGDKMYINLHDTSNTGIRNTNEVLNKLDIPYRIGSEFDEKLNETRYYLENNLTHSKAYFDKNGASWLSVSKTLRGKEIVPRRNAEEQAEYNMQMEQRRAEIEAEREQDRIKAEERKAEEERQQEIDKQMKANLLRYVDIKHNDNPLGRGRTLKDLSEKNSEANNRIRYYGDDVADDAGVWQVLDVLADKNGKIREVWESDSKSSYSYEYYDEELGRNNNISGLNKTQRDYLEYRIKATQTEKRVNNHLDKIENKSLKTRVENKLNEMKKWQDDNGKTQYGTDAQYIDYLVLDKGFTPKEFPTGKTYANGEPKIDYMIVNEKNVGYISSKIENDYARSLLETPEEEISAEDEAKLDELFTPKTTTEVTGEKNAVTAKQTENEKPKNLVTSRIENTSQEIQEIDKDTYFDDIVKNLKDHPREMFIYKDGSYFYPHYILPSGKVLTPENTYWGEVSSEEAAKNWLLKEAEEHSEENETKKAEKLKEIVGKTAEKYEATLKRIESDNPMQEIWTSGDYFKYGMGNNQMARAKKESEANAEVGTFKKDVIDGKEGYRIFVAGTKNEAIRAFYEPKTGKTYRIYRGPIIDDSKPYTTKQVERIEKFLQNVDKQLDKETKKEKKEEKQVITQERLDSLKPDKDGVIELDYKGDERWALGKGKEALIKEGKADGKYLYNYGGAAHPQYMALYIKNGEVYEGRKGLEDQYMTTKQEVVDWLNQKEKDVEHESTERYTQTDYETLPKTISVESEAEKAGPKRIAPDRVKRQQETYDQGLESVKNVLKQSPVKIYELGFKSDRSKAVQNILEERKRIRQLPETEAEPQWNELAKSVYEDLVIKDISKGYRYPEDVTSKFPKAQMKKAVDARARYEKGLFTSFSAKDTRANNQYRDEIGAGIKSQDGKPVTQEQMNEIVDGIRAYSEIFGIDMKKFAEDNNIIYVHLHGGNPFLMGGMNIGGLYRRDAAGNISVSLGGKEGVMEKGEDGEMKKTDIKTTTTHEITHAVDGMLDGKLFSNADIEILKKTMNKPKKLINYYNRPHEIVARAVEQYAAHKIGKTYYRRIIKNIDMDKGSVELGEKEYNYVDRQAYRDQENFDKYVKPIVEKNMKEKMKDYMIQQPKNNVLGNDKNKVTTQAARTSRPSIRMNVEEREKKNATANPMNKVTNKILKETKSELKELKHTISDDNIRSLQQKRKAGIGDNAEVYRGKINKRTKEVLDEMGIKGYFELVVEQNDINHLLNRHENNGRYSVTRDDVQNIPEIMLNADSIRAGGKTKTQGMNTIIFEKTIGDVKYVIAAHVGRKNKKVGPHTMRKKKA